MSIDTSKKYDAKDFFLFDGNAAMRLSGEAALEVCRLSTEKNWSISRIEGGIWHDPGFEARLDCIWDASCAPVGNDALKNNNEDAADFIREEMGQHDVFLITVSKEM